MRFWTMLLRSCRLLCPRCGQCGLYGRPFRMRDCCSECKLLFLREPGFYLGSIYFNYGLTALICSIGYPLLMFRRWIPKTPLMVGTVVFAVLFPLLFFHHARALWLGFDEYIDPQPTEDQGGSAPQGPAAGDR